MQGMMARYMAGLSLADWGGPLHGFFLQSLPALHVAPSE